VGAAVGAATPAAAVKKSGGAGKLNISPFHKTKSSPSNILGARSHSQTKLRFLMAFSAPKGGR